MNKEDNIIESEELRSDLANKVEVLNKVKELVCMPNTEVTTIKQVAAYYEVAEETIASIVKRNKDEIESNGYRLYKQSDVIDLLKVQNEHSVETFEIRAFRTEKEIIIGDIKIIVSNRGLRLFSRRAVLNVGMLLTESGVAKRVREYLLDAENNLNDEQKEDIVDEFTREQLLQLKVINASGSNTRMLALGELVEYQNEKAEKNRVKIENLTTSDATFGVREAKNNLGVGERKLVRYLLDRKFCYRDGGNGRLRPFTKYANEDGKMNRRLFTEIKTVKSGQEYTKMTITIEGIEYFRELKEEINIGEEI